MPTFSVTWPQPGRRTRVVIVVIIYVCVIRFMPHDAMPVIIGSLFSRVLTADSSTAALDAATAEGDI